MKVAVSLPDDLYERADAAASRLGLNRSQLFARAVEEFLSTHDADDPVTAALDDLADRFDPGPSPGVGAGRLLVERGGWSW